LLKKPGPNESAILVLDEANFNAELTGEGENFLKRFYNLKTDPPNDFAQMTGKKVYYISAATPYYEKENILRAAAKEGALIIANDFDASRLWPHKLYSSLLNKIVPMN
jgi:hypothetical protein